MGTLNYATRIGGPSLVPRPRGLGYLLGSLMIFVGVMGWPISLLSTVGHGDESYALAPFCFFFPIPILLHLKPYEIEILFACALQYVTYATAVVVADRFKVINVVFPLILLIHLACALIVMRSGHW